MAHNPYHRLRRTELHAAANSRARELMHPSEKRTPAQRAALAEDTGHLLLALAWHLLDNELLLGTPQDRVARGEGLAETFIADYLQQVRALRHATYAAALDLALSGGAAQWVITSEQSRPAPSDLASSSDDGLARVLRAIEDMRNERLEVEVKRHDRPPGEAPE